MLCGVAYCQSALPAAFEPNRGQAAPAVDYVARSRGYSLALSASGATVHSPGAAVTTRLVGARENAQVQAEEQLLGKVHYLRGRDSGAWLKDIPTFARVRYREVYPGVDVLYYGSQGRLEYDFVVAPGADPGRIRMRYEGASGLRVDAAGDLVLETGSGTLRHHRPVIYQELGGARRPVSGRYVAKAGVVRFALGRYDRRLPLVIDPVLTWSTYFGSLNDDEGNSVAVDSAGNVYMAGSTVSSYGDLDAFVTKLNPAGTSVAFTANVGGSADDEGFGLGVDAAGNVYLAGDTDSDDFPVVGVQVDTSGAGFDAFVVKLDPNLENYLYSTYLGGTNSDAAFGLALDAAGNAYVAGGTLSTDFPTSSSAAQKTIGGGTDGFLAAFDPTGAILYSTYVGGSGNDIAYALAADAAGNAYITGSTASLNLAVTSAAWQQKSAGGIDAFVAMYAPGGGPVYASYLGGAANDAGYGIAVDALGAAYVTGQTASADFPTRNAFQPSFGGVADTFVSKLAPDGGSLAYSTFLGGSQPDAGYAIAVDGAGNAYVAGDTVSTNYPLTDAFQGSNKGSADATVTGLDATGSKLTFATYLGGSKDDTARGIAVNCATGTFVVGTTLSTDFPVTSPAIQSASGGGADAYLARIAAGGGPATIFPNGVVNGATFQVAPIAAGSLVTVFGSNLAAAPALASSKPLSVSLGGARVAVGGVPAPLVYVGPGQINFQLPYETGLGVTDAVATACGGASAPVSFTVAEAAPYLLLGAGSQSVAQNQDSTVNGPGNGAAADSFVTVYLTGIGRVDNPVATGAAAPLLGPLSKAALANSATIGGQTAAVQFLGLAPGYVGLAQANLRVPASLGPGTYPVVITVGGVASNAANLVVR